MDGKYDHKAIEKHWQEEWAKKKLYEAPDKKDGVENHYTLVEFAYPSGDLHVGHWYAFSVTDMYARYMRMRGKNVMFPMGFDAFGLPAENAAIKRKIHPRTWTYENIERMKKQLDSMGASFDWSREVITSNPDYYKWTQWIFTKFFENGLAYRDVGKVNWCPSCKTVLANEQVIAGHCERCDSTVELREMEEWKLRITSYADRLIDDLEVLHWPEPIKEAQRNWIGRSEGAEITFTLRGISGQEDDAHNVSVFTTRPDTLFGATFLVVSPELAKKWLDVGWQASSEAAQYVKDALKKGELERIAEGREKTGVDAGIKAVNPANGEEIPVWIADYVVGSYGTGAIMAVPAHDERDYEFAHKFNLPVQHVVIPSVTDRRNPPQKGKENTTRKIILAVVYDPKTQKYLCLKWKNQPWTTFITGGINEGEDPVDAARREIVEETGYTHIVFKRLLGGPTESIFFAAHKDVNREVLNQNILFELQGDERTGVSSEESDEYDVAWLSKDEVETAGLQHAEFDIIWNRIQTGADVYTGEGILVNSGKFEGMESEEAKRAITDAVGGKITKTYRLRDWSVSRQRYWGCPIPIIYCEKCGVVAVPEKDLPVLLPDTDDFMPRDDGKSPLAKVDSFVKTECPKCGADAERETDTLDTFIDSSWYFLRYTDPHNENEFASKEAQSNWMPVKMYSGGAEHTTLHVLYSRFFQKALFDLGLVSTPEPYAVRRNRGIILGPDGQKMSKSKGNVINPDEYVEKLGADTVRMYLAFIGPYNVVGAYPWDPKSIVGVRRFLDRAWRLADNLQPGAHPKTDRELHKAIKRVTESIDEFKFNTGVAALMEFLNTAEKEGIDEKGFRAFLKLLAPFAPHISEELWRGVFSEGDSIHVESWPTYDESLLQGEEVTVVVQVNGKNRGELVTAPGQEEDALLREAKELPRVAALLQGGEPKRVVYVKDKLLNIVL